jgi:hypothetical protein
MMFCYRLVHRHLLPAGHRLLRLVPELDRIRITETSLDLERERGGVVVSRGN